MSVLLAFLALLAEVGFGYPRTLLQRIGHPVIWIGFIISACDRRFNKQNNTSFNKRVAGIASLTVIVALPAICAFFVQSALLSLPFGIFVLAFLAGSLIAQRSLAGHVQAVVSELDKNGIIAGRSAVAAIVGRDTHAMDESDVSRAAIESLAENFSDGVVAPALWLSIFGLPGIVAYKAINTADSMIGHRSEKYIRFGWAAARLDDLVNLPASRLSAFLVLIACMFVPGASARGAVRAIREDARRHRSPNAGWPEAAFAGALGIALAGPRQYHGVAVGDPFLNAKARRCLDRSDISRALRLFQVADAILIVIAGAVALVLFLAG